LAAGLPQLVMPMAFDQLDNATRLTRLGVAEIIPRKKFRGPAVARELDRLLSSESVREASARWAQRSDPAAGLAASCAAIEQLAQ
jgi:UDP:flavonoid glycosyltransferase YjiC (YdhE family)